MPVASGDTAIPGIRWPEVLKQRIMTAIIALAVLAIVLFVVSPIIARVVIAVVIVAGAWEWGGFLFGDARGGRVGYVFFIVSLMVVIALNLNDSARLGGLFTLALAWWLLALVWMLFFPAPIPKAITWMSGGLVLVPAWAALDQLYTQSPELLVFALLIVWFADIGAYFVGKGIGRVKLAPAISPGKTWEGVLGGLTAVTVLAAVGSAYFEIAFSVLVPFCLAVTMLSIVGDLTVSMFKRTAGVKDSGILFPGHGGVMDRIDSVSAAAPLFALALTWIGLN